jgi:DNA polymerase I-like protein with 3'-5' exonuclease and polymerase domains
MYKFLADWPKVSRNPDDLRKFYGRSPLGLDLEWDENEHPTILGISDGTTHVSVPYHAGLQHLRNIVSQYPKTVWVGHNIVGADLFVLQREGITIPLAQIEDTIIRHWLTNMHLSKGGGKATLEEDAGEKRGRGFNNLWTMASLYTDFPHWKDCRAPFCSGPCPVHDPYGYNGLDAAAPVIALPKLKTTMAYRGLEKLYPMHRELALALAEIREYGIKIDVDYVNELNKKHLEEKELAAADLPFNPDSHVQVLKYFNDGEKLRVTPESRPLKLENAQEETIRAMVEKLGGEELAPDELVDLLDYKELGNGPNRWFEPYYRSDKTGYIEGFLDPNGFVHPHLGYFTSSARLMCSSPNFQNVSKRRRSRKICVCGHHKKDHSALAGKNFCAHADGCLCGGFSGEFVGKKIRRAIIAPEGFYIVRADYSNAENRNFLYLAGYEQPEGDLHDWMVKNIGLQETDEFSIKLGSARDASKSVTHAADYFEGLQLKEPYELRSRKIRAEVDAGARVVFPEWTFRGKVVTITGINLARRAFGKASIENRAKANAVVSRYIDQTFPKLRDLQKKIMKQIEQGYVQPPFGYYLVSYGTDEDRIKTGLAVWGSQNIAHISKVALLAQYKEFKRDGLVRPILQVHDELLAYSPNSLDPQEAMRRLKSNMEAPAPEMEAWLKKNVLDPTKTKPFVVPTEASFGPNWRDQTKEKKNA